MLCTRSRRCTCGRSVRRPAPCRHGKHSARRGGSPPSLASAEARRRGNSALGHSLVAPVMQSVGSQVQVSGSVVSPRHHGQSEQDPPARSSSEAPGLSAMPWPPSVPPARCWALACDLPCSEQVHRETRPVEAVVADAVLAVPAVGHGVVRPLVDPPHGYGGPVDGDIGDDLSRPCSISHNDRRTNRRSDTDREGRLVEQGAAHHQDHWGSIGSVPSHAILRPSPFGTIPPAQNSRSFSLSVK